MTEAPASTEIRAAGALLWRPSGRGREVALVHRRRYDDWSFPKGKRERGEHILLTAVREVAEETGVRVILGRPLPAARYDRDGRPKRVDYWAGRPAAGGWASFRPNDEIDELAWLPVPAALGRLSYPHDAAMLGEFATGPADTVPFVLLRHASAVAKDAWPGDDRERPLGAGGADESQRLAGLLSCFGSARVISSPAERCLATIRPYAMLSGADLQIETALAAERAGAEPGAGPACVAAIVAAGRPAVICAHRENLPLLLSAACAALGAAPPEDDPLPPAGFWVLHAAGGGLAAAERHHPAEPLPAVQTGKTGQAGGSRVTPARMSDARGRTLLLPGCLPKGAREWPTPWPTWSRQSWPSCRRG
jgi:8-oxo-dGTP diphosphatase